MDNKLRMFVDVYMRGWLWSRDHGDHPVPLIYDVDEGTFELDFERRYPSALVLAIEPGQYGDDEDTTPAEMREFLRSDVFAETYWRDIQARVLALAG